MATTHDLNTGREMEIARRVAVFSSDPGCLGFEGVLGVAGRVGIASLPDDRVALGVRGAVSVLTADDACAVITGMLQAIDGKLVVAEQAALAG